MKSIILRRIVLFFLFALAIALHFTMQTVFDAFYPSDFIAYFAISLYPASVVMVIVFLIWQKKLIENILMVLLGVMILLNSTLIDLELYDDYEYQRISKVIKERAGTKCEQTFEEDLKSGHLYYFLFSIGTNEDFNDSLKTYYNTEVIDMGCLHSSSWDCYNEKVEEYLDEKAK